MASAHGRLGQHFMAVLDVALRVPSMFIIDAIFNSYSEPGSGWTGTAGRVFLRALGLLVSAVVLVLSQKSLLRFYTLFLALVLGSAAALLNYYATSSGHGAYDPGVRPPSGPALWLSLALLQTLLGLSYAALLEVPWACAALLLTGVLLPPSGLAAGLPEEVRRPLALASGLFLAAHAALSLLLRLRRLCHSCRYVCLLLRHMHRVYGLQLLLEDTWKRVRVPDVLRVFWLSRAAAQAVVLLHVVRGMPPGWDVLWELLSSLVISGCDSTLTVLGMSAVISSLAHYLGLSILAFIGSTEEEDKRLGFVAPVLFFILALQTGLSGLDPEERLVRLSRNMCLLLTAVLHFVHGMTDPVLMSLSASHVPAVRRHLPVLLVSLALLGLPVLLSSLLWRHHVLNTWLFAVTAFCVELCLKVLVSLTVYALFMLDGLSGALWEKLDDYVYLVRSGGNVVEFVFGVVMFGNGAYTMMFESGSKIRACMMCLHAYFNIYLQARNGWRTFVNRRTAVKKINSLPELTGERLRNVEDVCAICYQEFSTSARITPCRHYFHALCLRKWLYIQDTCPMCHQRVYVEEDDRPRPFSDHAGAGPEQAEFEDVGGAEGVEPEDELPEDNDSIEYDEDEWGHSRPTGTPLEDRYGDDDTD